MIERELRDINFSACTEYQHLCSKLIPMVEAATSEVIIRKRDRILKPYLNMEILVKIREKNNLYKLTRRFPNSTILKREYLTLKNNIAAEILERKREHYTGMINQNVGNPKQSVHSKQSII